MKVLKRVRLPRPSYSTLPRLAPMAGRRPKQSTVIQRHLLTHQQYIVYVAHLYAIYLLDNVHLQSNPIVRFIVQQNRHDAIFVRQQGAPCNAHRITHFRNKHQMSCKNDKHAISPAIFLVLMKTDRDAKLCTRATTHFLASHLLPVTAGSFTMVPHFICPENFTVHIFPYCAATILVWRRLTMIQSTFSPPSIV